MASTGLTTTGGPTRAVFTYNRIPGLPRRRHRDGDAVAYSHMDLLSLVTIEAHIVDKDSQGSDEPMDVIARDLLSLEIAYVYVGTAYVDSATLIRWLQGLKKQVVMVACDCHKEEKQRLATELGIEILWSGCGGGVDLMKIFDNTFFSS